MPILSRKEFYDEQAAYAYIEARVWPHGATCPKCGERERVSKMGGKSTRFGTYKCYACRKPFTVKIGTIFEASHVPMHIWLQAIYLMSASRKGISSNQLHRTLGVTLKTAWFMSQRVREALRSGDVPPMGGNGSVVEVEETFIDNDPDKPKSKNARGYHHKMRVLSLVDRSTGRAKSVMVHDVKAETLVQSLAGTLSAKAASSDEAKQYNKVVDDFDGYNYVRRTAGWYGRVHTNTTEGYFPIFNRDMKGVYQHCGKQHLHRYVAEFNLRYRNPQALEISDAHRASIALSGIVGKRLA